MRLWYVPSCDGTCHHWHQIYLFKANDDTQLHRIGAIFAPSRFYRQKGKLRFRLHAKSSAKMKEKVRAILDSNKPTSNEDRSIRLKQFIHGWVNDFKLIDMKQLLMEVDTWIRRKIRAIYWKQWKKVRTRYCMMRQYAIPEWKVHELASCRKGLWRVALMLSSFLTNEEIARPGYITMTSYYK